MLSESREPSGNDESDFGSSGAPAQGPRANAALLVTRGREQLERHDCEAARASADAAIILLRQGGSDGQVSLAWRRTMASARLLLGRIDAQAGARREADANFRRGLQVCSDVDAPGEQGELEAARAELALARGEVQRAVASFERGAKLLRRAGDTVARAHVLCGLGKARLIGGNADHAREELRATARVFARAGDIIGLGRAAMVLGAAEHALGNLDSAREHLARAAGVADRRSTLWAAACARHMAEHTLDAGEPDMAVSVTDRALACARNPVDRGSLLALRGAGHCVHGRWDDGIRDLGDALHTLSHAGDVYELAVGLFRYGHHLSGRARGASARLRRAAELFDRLGNRRWAARTRAAMPS